MEWFVAVVVVAILGVAAMAAAGGMGEMAKDPVRDTFEQDLPTDRALLASDISSLRFGVGLRGYSMSQVDDLLDRLTQEIAERDFKLAQLTASLPTGSQDDVPEPHHERSRVESDDRLPTLEPGVPTPATKEIP